MTMRTLPTLAFAVLLAGCAIQPMQVHEDSRVDPSSDRALLEDQRELTRQQQQLLQKLQKQIQAQQVLLHRYGEENPIFQAREPVGGDTANQNAISSYADREAWVASACGALFGTMQVTADQNRRYQEAFELQEAARGAFSSAVILLTDTGDDNGGYAFATAAKIAQWRAGKTLVSWSNLDHDAKYGLVRSCLQDQEFYQAFYRAVGSFFFTDFGNEQM